MCVCVCVCACVRVCPCMCTRHFLRRLENDMTLVLLWLPIFLWMITSMASIHNNFARKKVRDTQKRGKPEMRGSCRNSLGLHWSASARPAGVRVSPTSDTCQSIAILMNRRHCLGGNAASYVHLCRFIAFCHNLHGTAFWFFLLAFIWPTPVQ